MTEEMKDRRVIITGASSGIGRATAELFLKAGAKAALVARRGEVLEEMVRESGGKAVAIPADVTDEKQAGTVISRAVESMGGIDVLVNAAGIIRNGTIEETTLETWDQMMSINVRSVFMLMQLALPYLEKSRGSIVNVSSITGLRSFPGVLAYCVSKAGVDQLTRCAALELAAKGVRVNAVNPGVVVSGLHRSGGMDEQAYSAFLERSRSTHPMGRVGEAREVAELIFFLASDRAAWITGETISIDGGRALTCAR